MAKRTTLLRVAALAALALMPVAARAAADDDLDTLQEKAIKEAVRAVAPSVVQIETSGGTEMVQVGRARFLRGRGPTTGLIVSADGYIISSAFNFAGKPSAIRVSIPGFKERRVAEVVATDQTRMLTLLKVQLEAGEKLSLPVAVPKKEIKIGQTALAVGRTLSANIDKPPSVSVGIISAIDRIWGKALQTDAKVSPTNYGGPLVDLEGRVQGVLVPASPRAEGETAGFEWYDSGIGFAIPLEDVNRVLPRLKKGTAKEPVTLKRGVLGITMQGNDMYGTAAVVGTVAPGSAAEKAGIKTGDTIKVIDGKPIANFAQLQHRLGSRYEGDVVALKLQRGKTEISLDKVALGGAVAAFGQAFFGILPIRDDPGPGVEVRYVYPKSAAETAGLKPGDRLMKVGRQVAPGRIIFTAITGRDQLLSLFDTAPPGLELKFEVKRKDGKKTETLTAKLGTMPEEVPAKLPEKSSAGKALAKKKGAKPKKVETGLLKRTTPAADHSYQVFVPENYDANIAHAVVVWLHPKGRNKDRDVERMVDAWQDRCEDQHIIMIFPKSDNAGGWTQGESDFVQDTLKAVAEQYTIDRRRVIAHGMGRGGEMAFYLGFHARNLIRGVMTAGASLTSNPREKVANQPLAFYLVAGAKDPVRDAVMATRTKLAEHKYAVIYKEIADRGNEYPDTATLEEMVRWVDSLDRL